jgi:hypothetical protein
MLKIQMKNKEKNVDRMERIWSTYEDMRTANSIVRQEMLDHQIRLETSRHEEKTLDSEVLIDIFSLLVAYGKVKD